MPKYKPHEEILKEKGYIRLPEPTFLPERDLKIKTICRGYRTVYNRQAYFLALLGLTNEQIAQVLGVTSKTLGEWINKYPLFFESVKKGKIDADSRVAHALYQAAVGFSHPETVVISNKCKEYDERGRVTREWTEPLLVEVTKRYPPNVVAATKWLKARRPETWSDRFEVDHKLNISHNLDLTDFTLEELEILSRMGSEKGRIIEDQEAEIEQSNGYDRN
jgi:hypothetical protein